MNKFTLIEWSSMRGFYRGMRLLRGNLPEQLPDTLQERPELIHNAFMVGLCMFVAGMVLLFGVAFSGCAFGAEIIEGYTPDQWANAIYKAENSPKHPYGIMTRYRHTTARQACKNSVRHKYQGWRKLIQETGLKQGFLEYLGNKYAPIGSNTDNGTNKYWAKNVNYWLKKG